MAVRLILGLDFAREVYMLINSPEFLSQECGVYGGVWDFEKLSESCEDIYSWKKR